MISRTFFIGSASALALLAATATAAAADPASGQPASTAQSSTVSEIIVTGRMRSEVLQKAPIAVTAFTAKALTDANVRDVSDYIALTPNVSIVESQSAGNSFITIRGITQVRNGESPVAVVTDGVQQVSSRQFTIDPFDVQQIEVLRGPQGALYGRDAIGGAIIVTTKQPTDTFHESIAATVGNGDDYRVQAAVSGPILADKLLFRLSGDVRDFGGLLQDAYLHKTVDAERDRNIRGQLKAFLTDSLTADLHLEHLHTDAVGDEFQYQPAKFDPNHPCFLDPTDPFGGPTPSADRVSRTFCANNRGNNWRTIDDGSLKLEQKTGWATITNTFAVVQVSEYLGGDQFPYTASRNVYGTDGTQTQFETDRSIQDEFRIASPDSGRFKWMIGAYYLGAKRFISTTTGQDNGLGVVEVLTQPKFNSPVNPTLSYLADHDENNAEAIFGNLSYDITDQLNASVAYRYDWDHRDQIIDPLSTAGVPDGCVVAGPKGPCSRSTTFQRGQPKVTLDYTPSRDLTFFADYGVGFRSGEYNQSGAAEAANLPGVYDLVRPEVANTAEAGFKAKLLDGKLRINGTGYYTQDKDPFYFVFVGAVGAQILVNIDKVDLYGGEIEAVYSPIKDLNLFANYGYTHSRIGKYAFDPADVGNWAPYIPQETGSIGAQYRYRIDDSLNLFSRGEVELHGKQYWDPENSTARSAFALVNLQLGVESPDGKWSLTAFVNNLTDKAYNAEFVSGGFVQPAEPRTFGATLRVNL